MASGATLSRHGRRRSGAADAELLGLLYDHVGTADGWAGFAAALGDSYGNGIGMLATHDFAQPGGRLVGSFAGREAYQASYAAHYAAVNPWIGRAEGRPVGTVTASESLLPFAAFQRTEFFADWCRPQGIGAGVGVTVQRDGRRAIAVSVLFPRRVLERDADAAGRLQRLVPHLLRAAQLDRQLAALAARAETAERVLEQLALGLFLATAEAQVVLHNEAAGRMLATGDAITLIQGKLGAGTVKETAALRACIAAAARAQTDILCPPGGLLRLRRHTLAPEYEALVAPAGAGIPGVPPGRRHAAVFVRDPLLHPVPPAEALRRLYGLTAAEARLMRSLGAGETLEEAAARFAVGRETVRSQLRALFDKTGTRRQADLVRLVAVSLARLSGTPSGQDDPPDG